MAEARHGSLTVQPSEAPHAPAVPGSPTPDHERLKDLLAHLAELPPAARERRLAELAESEPGLIGELRSLAAFLDDGRQLETPVLERMAPAIARGQTVGPWALEAEIGRGGMGIVYRARRADGAYEGIAAVKLLPPLLGSGERRTRFLRECQLLAGLDHPGIARLLDAGTTEAGVAFIVMEYVEGRPIDAHCRAAQLEIDARLRLILQLCEALSAIHRRPLVHRDLKPANVLVDAQGRVKLLDFGIAKLLDASAAEATLDGGAYTPAYASPEQVGGQPVSTAADIFALGTLLYELLAGVHPFARPGGSMAAIIDAIARHAPPPPSRHAGPQRIAPDLDAIVLCALQKRPEHRYPSVEALAADLQRYLDGFPVAAFRQTAWYRGTKFLRRHWMASTAAALAIAAVLGFALRAEWMAREAQAQRALAERRFDQVRAIARAVIYDYDRALAELPGTLAVRKKLVADSLAYLDALAAEHGAHPALMAEIAQAYEHIGEIQGRGWFGANLGDTPAAAASLLKAESLRRVLLRQAPDDDTRREALTRVVEKLGDLDHANGRLEAARARYAQAESIVGAAASVPALLLASHLAQKQGDTVMRDGGAALERALAHFDRQSAHLARARALGGDPIAVRREEGFGVYARTNVALRLGRYDDALRTARTALAIHEEIERLRPQDWAARSGTPLARAALAQALAAGGEADAALREMRAAADALERLRAADAANVAFALRAATVQRRLAQAYLMTGQPRKALAAAEHSLRHAAAVPGENGLKRFVTGHGERVRGLAAAGLARYAQARADLERGCDRFQALTDSGVFGPMSVTELAACRTDQARVLAASGQTAAARARLAEAITLRRSWLAQTPADAVNRQDLALAYHYAAFLQEPQAAAERDRMLDALRAGGVLPPAVAAELSQPMEMALLLRVRP